ncbi:MAG: PD-(D/E)XK nuclease family protein [Candidatus Eremiobacteraeota bacterium]|nr:PD-(D/E)XK nuclease family protein [Candidatus Eremiobacteraeota bacterium]
MSSPEARAFLSAAVSWSREGGEPLAAQLLLSPFSGVPQVVGAAYATLARREGPLLDLMARERLAAGSENREALFGFKAKLENLRRSASHDDDAIRLLIEREFGPLDTPNVRFDVPAKGAALAAPAVPEPAQGMRSRIAHFSASSLNTYAECARKWYYRYMCAAIEDKGSSASFYGTAFHAALEDLHGEFPHPDESQAQDLLRKIDGFINAAFARFRFRFEAPVEYELQRRRAQRTGRRYVQWLLAEAKRAPFTVIGCELAAQLDLEGFEFIGYIDRLDREDRSGAVSVIDYKTGSIAATAAEYREKVRLFKDFQLPFYYWARTAQGDRVTRLSLIPLKDALLDVRPVSLEVVPVPTGEAGRANGGVISIADLERARARMIEICRELTSGAIERFAVTQDPAACTYCAYADACRERPITLENKFAR